MVSWDIPVLTPVDVLLAGLVLCDDLLCPVVVRVRVEDLIETGVPLVIIEEDDQLLHSHGPQWGLQGLTGAEYRHSTVRNNTTTRCLPGHISRYEFRSQ